MSTVRLVAKIAMAAQRLHAKAKPWEVQDRTVLALIICSVPSQWLAPLFRK
ncbi:hypothetical protein A1F94_013296 [Pyrenophora tritici-repentis]|uniref:Uncharacterized protein n=1 Tax=Pyrenophora tritici-repentis TaxID=45151 RepID=A0A317A6S9_9PLEO|nr:hypothetical protein PtrM4_075270 [Pyrenophora tritici-repentis]KAG9376030.1 hypothetical protein A1F94_013296 [Pyrenophora tritici-repentis]KAI1509565.1 hypothetical protein Ptr86124_011645 [Pyrenophora tritici-repentis]KAI1684620.1 hypothetical protein KJE20_04904 [Pyrenophora tritici-repentis]